MLSRKWRYSNLPDDDENEVFYNISVPEKNAEFISTLDYLSWSYILSSENILSKKSYALFWLIVSNVRICKLCVEL